MAVAPKHKFKFKNPLYAIDSTTIDLCHSRYNWAYYRKHKGAIKPYSWYLNAKSISAGSPIAWPKNSWKAAKLEFARARGTFQPIIALKFLPDSSEEIYITRGDLLCPLSKSTDIFSCLPSKLCSGFDYGRKCRTSCKFSAQHQWLALGVVQRRNAATHSVCHIVPPSNAYAWSSDTQNVPYSASS